jgi:hypothetical protein
VTWTRLAEAVAEATTSAHPNATLLTALTRTKLPVLKLFRKLEDNRAGSCLGDGGCGYRAHKMAHLRHLTAGDDVTDTNLFHEEQRLEFIKWVQDRARATGSEEINLLADNYTTAIQAAYDNTQPTGQTRKPAKHPPYFPQSGGFWFKIRWHHLWFSGTDVRTALFAEGSDDLRLPRSSRWAALVATSHRGGQPGSLVADILEIQDVATHRNYLCHAANHFFLLDTPTKEDELKRVEEAALDLCNQIISLVLPISKTFKTKSTTQKDQI